MDIFKDLNEDVRNDILHNLDLYEIIQNIRLVNKGWHKIADKMIADKIAIKRKELKKAIDTKENDMVLALILQASSEKYLPLIWFKQGQTDNKEFVSSGIDFNESIANTITDFLRKNSNTSSDSSPYQNLIQNLQDAELRNVNLDEVNLDKANLRMADLSDASLMYANLNDADLRNSYVCRTDFTCAYMSRVDFCGCNARGAKFDGTILTDSKFLDLLDGLPLKNKLDRLYWCYRNMEESWDDPGEITVGNLIFRTYILKDIQKQCENAKDDISANKKLKDALEVMYSHPLFEHRDTSTSILNKAIGFFTSGKSNKKNAIETEAQKQLSALIKKCSTKLSTNTFNNNK